MRHGKLALSVGSFAAALIGASLLTGCCHGTTEPHTPEQPFCDGSGPSRRACRKAWTVLVYMAADSADLQPQAYRDLHEMEAAFDDPSASAASTKTADVLVQLDVKDPPGIRRLHMTRGKKPFAPGQADASASHAPTDIESPVVEVLDEETISPGESLRRFLHWGMSSHPSEHYVVVVWGHGLGWRPADKNGAPVRYDPNSQVGGIAFDDSQGTVIDTPSLRAALASAEAEFLGGEPIDVYVSDACLMQSLEVATELSDVARYIVGTEQIEDYSGLAYRSFLPLVNGTEPLPKTPPACAEADTGCRIAAALPLSQREALRASGSAAAIEAFTLSTIDSAVLTSDLLPALRSLSDGLVGYVQENELRKIELLDLLETERISASETSTGTAGFVGGSRDVDVFLQKLSHTVWTELRRPSNKPVPAAEHLLEPLGKARIALSKTVIAAAFAPGESARQIPRSGVSVWLPHNRDEYRERSAHYASSRFYSGKPGSGFGDWLPVVLAPPRDVD